MTLTDALTDARAAVIGVLGAVSNLALGWTDVAWEVLAGTADTWFPMLTVLIAQIGRPLMSPEPLAKAEKALLLGAAVYVLIYLRRFRREAKDELND